MADEITPEKIVEFLFSKVTETETRRLIRSLATNQAQIQNAIVQNQQGLANVYKQLSTSLFEMQKMCEGIGKRLEEAEDE